jgi:O-6-methylguanine DNA methyltransferase
MKRYVKAFDTPYGTMAVAVDDADHLVRLVFPNGFEEWVREITRHKYEVVERSERCDFVIRQLDEYFQGKRRDFELSLQPTGTEFQKSVWTLLQTLPYGTLTTYKVLAERLGKVAAIRAVGRANATNPIPIVIPCHRVVGTDGSLTGFGGGLPLKEALLKLEGSLAKLF